MGAQHTVLVLVLLVLLVLREWREVRRLFKDRLVDRFDEREA